MICPKAINFISDSTVSGLSNPSSIETDHKMASAAAAASSAAASAAAAAACAQNYEESKTVKPVAETVKPVDEIATVSHLS